jgi:hypothetical protein
MNTLNDLFTPLGFGGPFDQLGTQIMKWNGQSFDVFTFGYNQPFGGIVWAENGMENGDATLLPGVGVLMNNVGNAPFTSTFIGLIREEQVFQIQAPTNSQPTINYLSATVPMAGRIPDITGYVPLNGDIIQLWNTTNRAYDSYSYISNTWPNGVPSVGAGEGFVLITSNAYIWTNSWQP